MPSSQNKNLAFRKTIFAGLLALICLTLVYAAIQNRDWNVPEEAKKLTNPLQPSSASLADARGVYREKCAQCHGESGKGDGHDAHLYSPPPRDFTDAARMDAVSDGELFYKISHGKKPMPGFQKRLSPDQRWELVLLIRSFAAPVNAPDRGADSGNSGTASKP
jgi:mono/diheme cytochrome c family protein